MNVPRNKNIRAERIRLRRNLADHLRPVGLGRIIAIRKMRSVRHHNPPPVGINIRIRRLDRTVEHQLIDVRIAIAPRNDHLRLATVNPLRQLRRIIILQHRIARTMIEHVARMHDQIRIEEKFFNRAREPLLMPVRVADYSNFHIEPSKKIFTRD